jgi:hypothetical protein
MPLLRFAFLLLLRFDSFSFRSMENTCSQLFADSLFELNGLLLVSSDACLPRLTIELLSLESPPQVYLGAPCSLTLDMVRLIRFDSFHLLGVGNLIFKSGSSSEKLLEALRFRNGTARPASLD